MVGIIPSVRSSEDLSAGFRQDIAMFSKLFPFIVLSEYLQLLDSIHESSGVLTIWSISLSANI